MHDSLILIKMQMYCQPPLIIKAHCGSMLQASRMMFSFAEAKHMTLSSLPAVVRWVDVPQGQTPDPLPQEETLPLTHTPGTRVQLQIELYFSRSYQALSIPIWQGRKN